MLSAPSLPTLPSHLRCGLMTSLPPGNWCPGVDTMGFRYESLLYSCSSMHDVYMVNVGAWCVSDITPCYE